MLHTVASSDARSNLALLLAGALVCLAVCVLAVAVLLS